MKNKHLVIIGVILLLVYSFKQLPGPSSSEAIVFDKENPPKILMLSTQTCVYCQQARYFFNQHQLPFTELDIEASEKNMQMFQLLGGRGTPLIIINGETIYGYSEADIRRAINRD